MGSCHAKAVHAAALPTLLFLTPWKKRALNFDAGLGSMVQVPAIASVA